MNCLDCKNCVPARKWLYVKNGINYGFRQLYVCKDKRRYIAKKKKKILRTLSYKRWLFQTESAN